MAKEKKTLTAAAIKRFPPAPSGTRVEHFDAAIPGFALRGTDKGERSFILLARIKGKLVRLTVGRAQVEDNGPGLSLADARTQARDWLMACAKGEDPRPEKKAAEEAAKAPPPSALDAARLAAHRRFRHGPRRHSAACGLSGAQPLARQGRGHYRRL